MNEIQHEMQQTQPVLTDADALAAALGLIPEAAPMTLSELLPYFDPDKLPRESVCLPEGF